MQTGACKRCTPEYGPGTCVCVCSGEKPWAARPPLPGGVPEEARQSGALATRPYLRAAAELVAGRSCTEGWLLQPKITDMPDLEYRHHACPAQLVPCHMHRVLWHRA